ncbi:protein-methionine-sulfoxide reductase catalytic subunit MsrP [Amphibiibacter pelophylacis]|uniref:Protein-methionine-sulfoxide reductase catalytic subunit MsrP n=1 Tax=Amphibiibacter pelophylacis TaxID=1799477 RepID=A0ACC6NYH0_9BURK
MSRHSQRFDHPVPSEITPPDVYLNRRQWMQGAALTGLGGALGGLALPAHAMVTPPGVNKPLPGADSKVPGARVDAKPTPYKDVSTYNNYYEFSTDKSQPARLAGTLKTEPWTVSIEGLVKKPMKMGIDELLKLAPMEERIYRLRCVEAWSMVVPWVGYSLSSLIDHVQPLGSAKYIEFVTLADKAQMPGLSSGVLEWPYREGLRMDEARHPLTLLTFGLYGEVLPKQNGAPLRVIVPWKYGFKSAKSLVAIRFLEAMPTSSWMRSAPSEYGFYANVNPQVDHPRWSQSSERPIGGGLFAKRQATQMFNGYGPQVASLYAGMDLRHYF